MTTLNLPPVKFKVKTNENKQLIFDIIRKKYVVLTPEEWVRQHVIHFLVNEKGFPPSLIAVEKEIKLFKRTKRFDILVFNNKGLPYLIVECKAPSIKLNQDAFDQIARYNYTIKAEYLMVTNGRNHYYCAIGSDAYQFLRDIPNYVKQSKKNT